MENNYFEISRLNPKVIMWSVPDYCHSTLYDHFCLATILRLRSLKKLTVFDGALGLLSVGPAGIRQSTSLYSLQVPVPYRIRPLLNSYGKFIREPE